MHGWVGTNIIMLLTTPQFQKPPAWYYAVNRRLSIAAQQIHTWYPGTRY